jgi:hypothetical protein
MSNNLPQLQNVAIAKILSYLPVSEVIGIASVLSKNTRHLVSFEVQSEVSRSLSIKLSRQNAGG